MLTSSKKNKARRLQQKIASDIVRAYDVLTDDDVLSRSMGAAGEDIILSPLARSLFPYSIEATDRESLSIWSKFEQARANAPDGAAPLLVFKKRRSKVYVVLLEDDLPDISNAYVRDIKKERLNVWRELKQVRDRAPDDSLPVLVIERTTSDRLAVLKWSEFLELL